MRCEVKIKDNKIFAPLKKKWLVLRPEERVRQEYICRLVNNYNYSLEQMEQEVLVSNTKRGTGGARADIIIYKTEKEKTKRKNAKIIVECKADNITIHSEDYYQGANYASLVQADFFVTTNIKETKVFKVVKGEIPNYLDEIIDIPNADIINSEKKVQDLLKQTKAFTREEFSTLLRRCHNIIRNNDKLSPEAAFDEISKILFIKIRYERTNEGVQLFSLKEFNKAKEYDDKYRASTDLPFYQKLFELTKKDFEDDDLFAENERLIIRENSFEAIVKELEKYNLSTTSDDVKGIAFEKFLGKTFRGELGEFFTPRTIVDFMVEALDPQEGEIICDPACGSGGFLIKAFEYVRARIEKEIHSSKEEIKKKYYTKQYEKVPKKERHKTDEIVNELFNKLNYELDINNDNSRLRKLSYDCIYGTDANPRMSRTAKMNMIMHGDGHGGVHHNDGLLNVNGVFENRFDIVLTNPPFGSRIENDLEITEADKFTDEERIKKYKKKYGPLYDKAMRQVNDNIGEYLLSLYDTGKMSTLTEVLFIERSVKLLKPGGRMGIVLPEGVLNGSSLQKIRNYFESKAKIILITSIPEDVFKASGANVKPSLVFFKKHTEKEKKQWDKISKKATKEINEKYADELIPIKDKLALRGKDAANKEEKKELRLKLKQLERRIDDDIKAQIKKEFNYEIPIAKVDKAGISTTGAEIENELIPLKNEFEVYRKKNKLWDNKFDSIKYEIDGDNKIYRMVANESQEIYE